MSTAPAPIQSAASESLSYTMALWKRGGLSWWEVIKRVWHGYRQYHFDARSAQFAYYSLLALFPLLILLLAVIAHLPVAGVLESSLEAADRGLPQDVYRLIRSQIADIQRHSTVNFLALNLGVLALAGTRVFLTITEGLNRAYEVRETRRFWQVYGMAFLLTIAASALALLAMLLMVVGPLLSEWTTEHGLTIKWLNLLLNRGVRWGVICSGLWLSTSTIYWLGPNVRLPWSWLSPGSVAAVIGWVLASQGFRLYVESLGRYNETYGALGGVIVLIIWLDLTGAMLLLGGEINAVLHRAITLPAAVQTTP